MESEGFLEGLFECVNNAFEKKDEELLGVLASILKLLIELSSKPDLILHCVGDRFFDAFF